MGFAPTTFSLATRRSTPELHPLVFCSLDFDIFYYTLFTKFSQRDIIKNMGLINIIQIILSGLLISSILLQQRGTGLGGAFAGDAAVYRSRRGAEKILFIATIIFAILFGISAILDILY